MDIQKRKCFRYNVTSDNWFAKISPIISLIRFITDGAYTCPIQIWINHFYHRIFLFKIAIIDFKKTMLSQRCLIQKYVIVLWLKLAQQLRKFMIIQITPLCFFFIIKLCSSWFIIDFPNPLLSRGFFKNSGLFSILKSRFLSRDFIEFLNNS